MKIHSSENQDDICTNRYGKISYCRLSSTDDPQVALIGDSFAFSIYYGLDEYFKDRGKQLLLLWKGGCPPLLDVKIYTEKNGAELCNGEINIAINKIINSPNIKTVILMSNWHLYFVGNR